MIGDAARERCRLDRGQGSSRSFDRAARQPESGRAAPLYIINIGFVPILPSNLAERRDETRERSAKSRGVS